MQWCTNTFEITFPKYLGSCLTLHTSFYINCTSGPDNFCFCVFRLFLYPAIDQRKKCIIVLLVIQVPYEMICLIASIVSGSFSSIRSLLNLAILKVLTTSVTLLLSVSIVLSCPLTSALWLMDMSNY